MPNIDASLARGVQAVNHGVPEALLEDLVSKGREMFSLPKSQKTKFKVRTRFPRLLKNFDHVGHPMLAVASWRAPLLDLRSGIRAHYFLTGI